MDSCYERYVNAGIDLCFSDSSKELDTDLDMVVLDWANAEEVGKGYRTGWFGPSDPITREQLAVMFYRYAGKGSGLF